MVQIYKKGQSNQNISPKALYNPAQWQRLGEKSFICIFYLTALFCKEKQRIFV